MCLGSIAAFIAMNLYVIGITNYYPSQIDYIYWQRRYMMAVMNDVTIPGIWLLFLTTAGLFFFNPKEKRFAGISLLILSILILLNGIFIKTIAISATNIAIQMFDNKLINKNDTLLGDYFSNKGVEDIFGSINLLLLIIFLIINILSKKKILSL